MHNAVRRFISKAKENHPHLFKEGGKIIECGSMDVNGSAKEFFDSPEQYVGIDWRDGEGVDVVSFFHKYDEEPDGHFDVAVSTETFEHDPYWKKSLRKMLDKIRLGGSLIISCGGPNRHHHQFQASPKENYYENLTLDGLRGFILENSMFRKIESRYSKGKNDIYILCLHKTRNDGFPSEHLFPYLSRKHEFQRLAEIGVASGNLANRVLTSVAGVEKYYAVDPWKVYIESYNRPPHAKEKQQSWWDSLHDRVKGMEERFPALEVMRLTSVKASKVLLDRGEKLDCVYIDAIHDKENIIKDIYCWLVLVRDGGVLCGHDYTKAYTDMCLAMNIIFEEDLNCMVMDPSKPALSYKNTYQGGNWWVHVTRKKKLEWYPKILKHFEPIVKKVEKEQSLK
jgi:SAM-dependent methyltransferase